MRRVGARCETMHSGVEGLCTSRAHRGEGSGEETACCEREGDTVRAAGTRCKEVRVGAGA